MWKYCCCFKYFAKKCFNAFLYRRLACKHQELWTIFGGLPCRRSLTPCVSPSRAPVLSFARYFQAPATQATVGIQPGAHNGLLIQTMSSVAPRKLQKEGWRKTALSYPLDVCCYSSDENVSWRRRAQIKQLAWPLAWPMAERQTGFRKSRLVLSARFPVIKWRSCSVAKFTEVVFEVSVMRESTVFLV